jgi:hypothetical protein
MNRPQRVILIIYCFLLTYCFTWVPWCICQQGHRLRLGYGWVWYGSTRPDYDNGLAAPDFSIIILRVLAVSAIAAAAWLTVWKSAKPER